MNLGRESKAVYSTADGLRTMPVGPWAEKKYSHIKLYIELFSTGMKKIWQYRVYVDLFSGPGKVQVRNTEKILLGSPLLALGIRDKFSHHVFCDQNPIHIALDQHSATESYFIRAIWVQHPDHP